MGNFERLYSPLRWMLDAACIFNFRRVEWNCRWHGNTRILAERENLQLLQIYWIHPSSHSRFFSSTPLYTLSIFTYASLTPFSTAIWISLQRSSLLINSSNNFYNVSYPTAFSIRETLRSIRPLWSNKWMFDKKGWICKAHRTLDRSLESFFFSCKSILRLWNYWKKSNTNILSIISYQVSGNKISTFFHACRESCWFSPSKRL